MLAAFTLSISLPFHATFYVAQVPEIYVKPNLSNLSLSLKLLDEEEAEPISPNFFYLSPSHSRA